MPSSPMRGRDVDHADDVGARFGRALEELWEYGQQVVADNGGEPEVIIDWRAPGVEPGEHDELIAEALAALRREPEDRGPDRAGPR